MAQIVEVRDSAGNLLVQFSDAGLILSNGAKLTIGGLKNAGGDLSAKAQGVGVDEVYRNGSLLMIRVK